MLAVLARCAVPDAAAQVPSAANSYIDPCVRVCPAGDITFRVEVRDADNNPIQFSTVRLDFGQCADSVLCPLTGSEPYEIAGSLITLAAPDGIVNFPSRAGGVCSGGVAIYANQFLMGWRSPVSSPDQNGDGVVEASDQAILTTKLEGPYDPTADLNCNGLLETGDQDVFTAHLGHMCDIVVPARTGTWGRIKTLYR